MTRMKVTLRVEVEDARGQVTTVERTVVPENFGDNPAFFGDVAEQASYAVRLDVVDALNAVHGTAPHSASVTISR